MLRGNRPTPCCRLQHLWLSLVNACFPPKNWRVQFVTLLLCQLTDVFHKAAAVLYMLISNYNR